MAGSNHENAWIDVSLRHPKTSWMRVHNSLPWPSGREMSRIMPRLRIVGEDIFGCPHTSQRCRKCRCLQIFLTVQACSMIHSWRYRVYRRYSSHVWDDQVAFQDTSSSLWSADPSTWWVMVRYLLLAVSVLVRILEVIAIDRSTHEVHCTRPWCSVHT